MPFTVNDADVSSSEGVVGSPPIARELSRYRVGLLLVERNSMSGSERDRNSGVKHAGSTSSGSLLRAKVDVGERADGRLSGSGAEDQADREAHGGARRSGRPTLNKRRNRGRDGVRGRNHSAQTMRSSRRASRVMGTFPSRRDHLAYALTIALAEKRPPTAQASASAGCDGNRLPPLGRFF
jgi:hypothetical protein